MKQPKKLTRTQKEILSSQDMRPDEYMLEKESEFYLYLVHKTTGKRVKADNFFRRKNGNKNN